MTSLVWHMDVQILRVSSWNSHFLAKIGLPIIMQTAMKISKDCPAFIDKHAHTVGCTSQNYWNFGLLFWKIETWQNWKQKHERFFLAFIPFLHYGFLKLKNLAIFEKENINCCKIKITYFIRAFCLLLKTWSWFVLEGKVLKTSLCRNIS